MRLRHLLPVLILFASCAIAPAQRQRLVLEQFSDGPGVLGWKDSNGAEQLWTIPSGALGAATWVLPSEDLSGGGCFVTDGAGVVTVDNCGAGGGSSSSGGVNQIQLSNGSGGFTNRSGFYFDGETLHVPRSTANPSTHGAEIYFLGSLSGSDFVWSAAGHNMRVITNRASDNTMQLVNVGAGKLDLDVDGRVLCPQCPLKNVANAWTQNNTFSGTLLTNLGSTTLIEPVDIGGGAAAVEGRLRIRDPEGIAMITLETVNISSTLDYGRITTTNEFGGVTRMSVAGIEIGASEAGPFTTFGPNGINAGSGGSAWSYGVNGITRLGTSVLSGSNNALHVGPARITTAGTAPQTALTVGSTVHGDEVLVRFEYLSSTAQLSFNKNLIPSTSGSHALGRLDRPWGSVVSNFYYGVSGVAGTSATLACGSGQAVKNITVSSGIVTAVSCGAP